MRGFPGGRLHELEIEKARKVVYQMGALAEVTLELGAVFLGFQYYEFTHFVHEGLTIPRNVFGSAFFVLTGFHGVHVTVGVIWMITLLILALRGRLPPERALAVEIAGLYWHFVDIVWIAIFTLIYLLQDL